MKVEYRILTRNGRHYPQTRAKRFLFWTKWYRIGRHLHNTFGLYDTLEYPMSEELCERAIKDYDFFLRENVIIVESYKKIDV